MAFSLNVSSSHTLSQLSCPTAMGAYPRDQLILSILGTQDYLTCLSAMQQYTRKRSDTSPNQIWLTEHQPVYTRGKLSHSTDIIKPLRHPIVDTDRGGQITFHGPGQIIAYLLLNLEGHHRMNSLVSSIEQTMIRILARASIHADADAKHRGVYVDDHKIGSIGLRMRRHFTYHGFSLNAHMDLSPFEAIHPCGRPQTMTQISHHSSASLAAIYHYCIDEVRATWGQGSGVILNQISP